MRNMSNTNPLALITGASSGIGAEIARELAARRYDLVLAARRVDRLEQLAAELRRTHSISVTVIAADLSAADAARELWSTIGQGGRAVDVLVNNAGVGLVGNLADGDVESVARMMRLNMELLTSLTQLALPGMLQRRGGGILNVASLAGFQPAGPGMAVYYATKSYVVSLTRALAAEVRGSGVTVTALCPGPTRTEFDTVGGAARTRLFRWLPLMEAREAAAAGVRGLLTGRTTVVPGWFNKLLAVGGELPPRTLATALNGLLLRE
jgi:short-subunit dehydrogenase